MTHTRRVRHAKRHRRTRRSLLIASATAIFALLAAVAFIWSSRQPSTNTVPNEPSEFTSLKNHYISVMKNLNSTQTRTEMASQLNPTANQTDLFTWEHSKLTFAQDTAGFFEEPMRILSSGKGICVQWSIVYISACLALNHSSRLVVATDTSTWSFIHTWAEDYYNGSWVHVDPSDSVWNNPSRYAGWDWGNDIGGRVKIYAFTDSGYEDVTQSYAF
jgi:Transglutaminase-like superfamily